MPAALGRKIIHVEVMPEIHDLAWEVVNSEGITMRALIERAIRQYKPIGTVENRLSALEAEVKQLKEDLRYRGWIPK